jgi:NAD+ synthase (glutamine-hydrolysing)
MRRAESRPEQNGPVPVLRVALAQIDLTVGDLAGNVNRVLDACADAAGQGAQLVALPEMALTGYPPEDLVLRASFRAASLEHLEMLAGRLAENGLGELAVVVGYLGDEDGARNACAFCLGGRVVATYYKHHLPNYGVFDERRYFIPGDRLPLVSYRGADIAMTICEDAWQDGGPFTVAGLAGAGLVLCINGSPYERNKDDTRLELLQRRVAEAGCPVVYVNTVGGQDELVFDGDSFVVDAAGQVLLRAPQFVEGVYCLDLELPDGRPGVPGALAGMDVERVPTGTQPGRLSARIEPVLTGRIGDEAEVWGALVTGTRDYIVKNGFRSVVLGMSGGIDSAVVATVAADAVGGENVYGVSMPSGYSSVHSRSDAADLAHRIGAHYQVVPIASMVDAFVGALDLSGVAEENVQARVRGTTLMSLSNQHGHLVLATGNKSELAVGYSTIYGDAVGGFAPLKDVPKTLVWALARWRNEQEPAGTEPPIPPNSISKPPSAELRPGQLDSDSLPDYALLDPVIAGYVDGDLGVDELIAQGHDAAMVRRVARMVDAAEWKRRQYPPGPKISLKAFGRDRRLPIANRWGRDAVKV